MRDYTQFDKHLNSLIDDVYDQPEDLVHTEWALKSLEMIPENVNSVLDVGCGTGFLRPYFNAKNIVWTGISLDKMNLKDKNLIGKNYFYGDFSFLRFDDEMFDMVYARHALEHSPHPIVTLMEWHRVARDLLLLIAPAPEYWTYAGKNHYSVANEDQLWWWLRRSGWEIITREYLRTSDNAFMKHYLPDVEDRSIVVFPGSPKVVEYRYLCQKVEPIKE